MIEPQRDYVGYGRRPPVFTWPGGRRLAVSVVVNYEEGGESCILEGDACSETLNSDMPGTPPRPGRRNLVMESHYEYGSRVGHWRILDILEECGIPATYFAISSALEKNPEAARAIVAAGHEVVSHGKRWIDYELIDPETENAHIVESLDVIEALCGERPVGWYTGRIGLNTRRLVQSNGLMYDSDAYNDDLPYWVRVNGMPHLVVPYSFDCNDMRFASAPGFNTPDDFTSHLRRALDGLRRETVRGAKMMSIGLHLRLAGRPARAEALREFLLEAVALPEVWFCRRRDIAEFWRAQYPPAVEAP